jgi:magnesium chelatase family protein
MPLRLSGPLLDHIDMQIEVPTVPQEELMGQKITGEKSSIIRQRVQKSHQLQLDRQGKTNNRLNVKEINKFCGLDNASKTLLKQAISRLNLSVRAYHRILKVAKQLQI